MAPLKREERMKQLLEERSIEPSADAWERLEKKLDENTNSRSGSYLLWLGLAAASIILLVMLRIYPKGDENLNVPVIVDTVDEEKEPVIVEDVVVENEDSNNAESETLTSTEPIEEEVALESPSEKKDEKVIVQKPEKVETALALKETKNTELKLAENVNGEVVPEEVQVEEQIVIAENQPSEQQAKEISTDELDDMLERARIRLDLKKQGQSVNEGSSAQALLNDVELDLDRSLRDRVIRTLVSGYKSVKTAVAERNN